jgi:serine/threonine protein kinase
VSTNTPSCDRDPIEQLAEAFVERYRRGERPSLTEYAQAYPDLAEQIRDLFPALVLIEEGKLGKAGPHVLGPAEGKPERLGEYRILREVGRGGMGVVYEAVQESLGRHVALKVLPHLPLMDPIHLKRFHREARAAALLHHSNIVPVYGVGEQDGVHYYAMQFIEGLSLDAVIKGQERRQGDKEIGRPGDKETARRFLLVSLSPCLPVSPSLNPARVAQIGVQVAQALAHAHDQGVLHRDIKPSNLMLDNQGTVWVTDFGLAKTGGKDDVTHTGDLVGTLRYMAPERFAGWADPRSDLYSLGLTLYELLALRPAFDAADRAALIKQVTEKEPVPPRQLDPRIPRDLETIVLKATAKEPAQRYQSGTELAEDLSRFLADKPILARRTSHWEHFRRWCRHNPAVAALSTVALALLLIGLAAVSWQWQRAESQRHQAEANFQKARDAVDECFTTVTANPVLQEPGMEAARQVLFQAALKYYQEFLNQRGDDPAIQADLAQAYYRVGYVTERIGSKTEALLAYQQARDLFEKLSQARPDDSRLSSELAQCRMDLGDLYRVTGSPDQAETEYLQAIGLRERLVQDHPTVGDYQNDLAKGHQSLAGLYAETSRSAQAGPAYNTALAIREQLIRQDPQVSAYRSALAKNYNELARFYSNHQQPDDAERTFAKALDLQEQLVRDQPTVVAHQNDLATTYNNLGTHYVNIRGTIDQMKAAYLKALLLREQLARDHPKITDYQSELAKVHNNLGLAYYLGYRFGEAETSYRKALPLREQLAQKHPEVADYQKAVAKTHHDLGLLYRQMGRPDDSRATYRKALAIQERLHRDYPTASFFAAELGDTLKDLAELANECAQGQEALEWCDQAIHTLQTVLRTEPQHTLARRFHREAWFQRARALHLLGRYGEALQAWDLVVKPGDEDWLGRLGRACSLVPSGNYRQALDEANAFLKEHPSGANHLLCVVARIDALASVAVRADDEISLANRNQLTEQYAGRAVELLGKVGATGYFRNLVNFAGLTKHPDLDPLRSRTDFQKLLAAVANEAKK